MKRVMAERGLKSVDLAGEVITVQYVSKLVTGRTKSPTWDKAIYIIEKLGMTPSEFRLLEIEYDGMEHKRKAH